MNALAVQLSSAVLAAGATEEGAPASGIPDPGLGEAPPEIADRVNTILSLIAWLGVAACIAGVFFTAIAMVIAYRRGDLSDQMGRFGMVLAACILIGGASGLVTWAIG